MTNAKGVLEWMAWQKERKATITNEEWFCQLPTSEKAKVLSNATYSSVMNSEILIAGKEAEQKKWELWLKEKHYDM